MSAEVHYPEAGFEASEAAPRQFGQNFAAAALSRRIGHRLRGNLADLRADRALFPQHRQYRQCAGPIGDIGGAGDCLTIVPDRRRLERS